MFYKIKFKVRLGLLFVYGLSLTSSLLAKDCLEGDILTQRQSFKFNDEFSFNNINFCNGKDIYGKTFFSFRPQDSNSASKILGLLDQNKRFNFTMSYHSSFNNDNLAKWFLFNGSKCMSVGIAGGTESFDVDGGQVGLSLGNQGGNLKPGSIGELCVNPSVKNFVFGFDWNMDLSHCCDCLWARLSTSVVRSTTNLKPSSTGSGSKKENYPAGLFSIACNETAVPFENITDAFQGDRSIGDVPKLSSSKFSKGKLTKTDIPSIGLILGYDICNVEDYYAGLGLNIIMPTGNRPKGRYLLEPVVGANHSFQLGGLLEGYKSWGNDCSSWNLYFYGSINHIFRSKQCRTFALNSFYGAGSQFLLVKGIATNGTNLEGLSRIANILNGYADIGADATGDIALMLQRKRGCYFMNIGYNLWFRTKEKLKGNIYFSGFQDNKFGVKGNTFTTEQTPGCTEILTTANASTISKPGPEDTQQTMLFATDDINVGSALHPFALSNKLFCSLGYNFYNCIERDDRKASSCNLYSPIKNICKAYFVLSGEVEFGNKAALSQWGVVGKLGVEF